MFQENISKLPYKLEDVLTVKLSEAATRDVL